MKTSFPRGAFGVVVFFITLGVGLACRCRAQDNVWTSPASGNWQDQASWSLGILPATNQTIWLTNAGWKAVQIGSGTSQNFPESLTVDAINISSPTNSFNTLLLNYAGAATPLTVKALSVGSNSVMSMVASGLQINGPNGSGMTIGGEFDQNDSVVGGNQINVGYIGPGVYNFNGGYLAVSQLWVGGSYQGVLNQNGGTNAFGITHLDGGNYVLSNGFYGATIYFDGGTFQQEGGILTNDLTLFRGTYVLDGGVHQGSATVPSPDEWTSGNAGMVQTAGTNYGSFNIGSYGSGSYTMSNGVAYTESMFLAPMGTYHQVGGLQIISGGITIDEQQVNRDGGYEGGNLDLDGGQLISSGITSTGFYTQTGGTNSVSGGMTIYGGEETRLSVSGGLLAVNNLTADPAYVGGVYLTGGTVIITNTLQVGGLDEFIYWEGFLAGGQLIVSNIYLAPDASFSCRNGIITQSGTLTLAGASLYAGSNSVQFGRLCLADGGSTNSTIYMPASASVVNFGDSSSITWSNDAALIVEGWSGSLYGGGQQEINFGKDSGALTAAQLAQIKFHNPAGLAEGAYPARILSSGEIVPNSGAALPANMALAPQPGGMQITLRGEAGRTYSIEVSTDLVHWALWTNQVCTNGTICVTDTDATNCPVRFYRARAVP